MFKALIVDDEDQIRQGLSTIVPWESFGFVVAGEAPDGVSALAVAGEMQPDLVVTDIKMPGMGGIELARELKSKYPEMTVLILSGYNEFTYAKEALKYGVADYLLKPVDPEELGRALEQARERLMDGTRRKLKEKEKEKSLRNVFLGKLVRGEVYGDAAAAAQEHGISLRAGPYCVMVVSLDRYGEMVLSRSEQEIGLIKFALENIIEELLGRDGWFFALDEQRFAVLLAGSSLKERDFRLETARRFVDNARRYAKESLTVASGLAVHSPGQISESYSQAVKALDRKFYYEMERVFLYDPDDRDEGDGADGFAWDDSALLAAIRDGQPERIKLATDGLFVQQDRYSASLDQLKHRTMLTIIRMAKLTEENHGEWQAFYTGKFRELEQIFRHGDIQRLKAFIGAIALEIGGGLEAGRTRKTESRIREIVEHIDKHYHTDLNLKELSKLFYINAVYLGQLFKKETGEFFNDYINKVRIREACRLLEETGLTAAEIAERAGYKYVDHFYRHFKQIHGMSPGEYRQRQGDHTL